MVTTGLFLATVASPSPADTIVVTTDSGGTGGPDCTLRDAITAANTDTATGGCPAGNGADTIELPTSSTITLTEVDNDTSGLIGPNGLPSVTSVVTIRGTGTTVQRDDAEGTPLFRILHVAAEGDLTLNFLVVTGGAQGAWVGGGGIYNEGTLNLTDTSVHGNVANKHGGVNNSGTLNLTNSIVTGNRAAEGGGIYNSGTLNLNQSTVTENRALWGAVSVCWDQCWSGGGGIYNDGEMNLTNSTISANRAAAGGGILNNGSTILINCTVSENGAVGNYFGFGAAPTYGGGVFNGGPLTLINSTISDNRADQGSWDFDGAGGIYSISGPVSLTNSIVANSVPNYPSRAAGADCVGTVIDDGHNIIEDGSCISDPTSMSGDPGLGLLDDNGGPTLTHALLPGSIAFDAIDDPFACTIDSDQRGVPRPQGPSCDIGAFERQWPPTSRRAAQ